MILGNTIFKMKVGKPRAILEIVIFSSIILWGCPESQVKTGQDPIAKVVEVEVTITPDRWAPGDSIEIEMECLSRDEKLVPVNSMIYISNIESIKNLEAGILTRVRWATDSVPFLRPDRRSLIVEGFFEKPSDSIGVITSEEYEILQDSTGLYYFHPEEGSYKLDTMKLE